MRTIPTPLRDLVLIETELHGDARGFFQESYRRNVFKELGITEEFVQHNHSRSRRGIVRGMHFQPTMSKLIRCVRGAIFDVAVDIRPESQTFGDWEGFELSDENHYQLYCPAGFAHGFCVLSEVADVIYSCSDYYSPEREQGFAFDDPDVGISWPRAAELTVSPRDASAPKLSELRLERLSGSAAAD
jgi:dTDP-4-dehydrorhamnose 3,5-epimerase